MQSTATVISTANILIHRLLKADVYQIIRDMKRDFHNKIAEMQESIDELKKLVKHRDNCVIMHVLQVHVEPPILIGHNYFLFAVKQDLIQLRYVRIHNKNQLKFCIANVYGIIVPP